jgi:basic amino acid/polyamine antiporter, APA family
LTKLARSLTTWDGVALLVGIIVGSGIFSKPGQVLAALGSPTLTLLAWAVGGAISLLGALVFAELGALRPASGGMYVFLRDAFGVRAGFVFATVALFGFRPLSIAGIARICGDHLVRAWEPEATRATVNAIAPRVAAFIVLGLTLANVAGVRSGARVQNVFTVSKIAALVFVIGAVLAAGDVHPGHFAEELPRANDRGLGLAWGAALLSVLWAYDGWADVSYLNGEFRDPAKGLPRVFVYGTAAVVGLYLVVNAAYLLAVPPERLAASQTVAADALASAVGGQAPRLAAIFIAVSTFGAVNGSLMSGARIFFAAGEDGVLPRFLARVHATRGTPEVSLLVQGLLAAALVFGASFDQLADGFTFTTWLFYVPAVAAVFVFRRKMPDAPRPYRTPFYPWTPLVFIVAALAFIALNVVDDFGDLARMKGFGWFSSEGGGPGVFDLSTAVAFGCVIVAWLVSYPALASRGAMRDFAAKRAAKPACGDEESDG